jgi:hypothetical protein
MSGQLSRKRLLIAIYLKLIAILIAFRYGLSVIFNTSLVLWLTSDANHLLGNKTVISANFAFSAIIANLMICLSFQWFEFRGNSYAIKYLFEIKYHLNDNQLKSKLNKKFIKYLYFISKYMTNPLISVFIVNASLLICLPPVIALCDSNSTQEYSVILTIIWTFISIIFIINYCISETFRCTSDLFFDISLSQIPIH